MVRPNLEELLGHTPAIEFAYIWTEWRNTNLFYIHYTELLRIAALYKWVECLTYSLILSLGWKKQISFNFTLLLESSLLYLTTLWIILQPTSSPVVLLPMSWSGEVHAKIRLWRLKEVLTLDNWHFAQVWGSMAGYGHDPCEGFTRVAQHCSFNSSQGWGGGP